MTEDARAAAERTARASYGRLVALLASRAHDVAAAEDALADAFAAALRTWPERGVPGRPEAWLLTAARRNLGGGRRRGAVRSATAETVRMIAEELADRDPDGLPDERLKLLFVCAHPAIDEGARTPLMLQTVLGLDAARIAAAFLTAPAAMGQRLVRAKTKIRDARLRFATPERRELAERLPPVLAAVYAAYGAAWDAGAGVEASHPLAAEALFLARLLVDLLPDEPEALGLLALLLHCEARADARRVDGAYVPLAEQDPRLWSRPAIGEAEAALRRAAAMRRPGRFQLEAAIQSFHVEARLTGRVAREALVSLYDRLVGCTPALGVRVARAVAHADAFGPAAGLSLLDAIAPDRVGAHQPYWAARAHLLDRAGRVDDARRAYVRAIGLSEDPAVRAFLAARAQSSAANPAAAPPAASAALRR